jgi:transglutaminase-like putative cysteine protease
MAFAETVTLSAVVTYKNTSDKVIRNVKHAFTIPETRFYQKLESIKTHHIQQYQIKQHKNGHGKYIEFIFDIPKKSTIEKRVDFTIDLQSHSLDLRGLKRHDFGYSKEFLSASKKVQMDDKRVRALSGLIRKSANDVYGRLYTAFKFPSQYLYYKPQKMTSAIDAIKSGIGDCTEYSLLFTALSRSLNIPTRVVSTFHFSHNKMFKMPNHHISEIYTKQYGWVPVYPNLSQGKYEKAFSLGKVSDKIIVFKHKNWTWSSNLKKKKYHEKVKRKVFWKIKLG